MLFFKELMDQVARLSCSLQEYVRDALFARSAIELEKLRELGAEDLSKASQLSKFLEEAELSFQTDLNNACLNRACHTDIETGLHTIDLKVWDYAHSLIDRLNQRFNDLQTDDVFKGIMLLDTCLWPNDKIAIIAYRKEQLSSVQKRFVGHYIKHNISVESHKT